MRMTCFDNDENLFDERYCKNDCKCSEEYGKLVFDYLNC